MLKYLVILLDDTAVPFCHYSTRGRKPKLIGLEDLAKAIRFGMKENLMIQFVYPDSELPAEHEELIDTIDHVSIKPATLAGAEDIPVGSPADFAGKDSATNAVLMLSLSELTEKFDEIAAFVTQKERTNIVLTDISELSDSDLGKYGKILDWFVGFLSAHVKDGGRLPQVNILTDRMMLTVMNNCNAGYESITLAPDGKFYVCPAFYYGGKADCGSLSEGLNIRNPQLYRLDHAPICRKCDAWHCRRCVWLNEEKTLEVNTPGHIQCMVSHLERNASRKLLEAIRENGEFMPGTEIPEVSYLDPFETLKYE